MEQTQTLYDAALEGNVASLFNVLESDPLILDRCSFLDKSGRFLSHSPLHIASEFGHLEFVKEILCRKPWLADPELDHSQRLSPLHLASANGHLEIVKALLAVNPNLCMARDQDGRNPIHMAAIRGQIEVLDELLEVELRAAQEVTNRGETVLHLCVKYKQIQALKHLVNALDDADLLNFKDPLGNMALHLGVATGQTEMVKFLLEKEKIEKNMMNGNGHTAMDICRKSAKLSANSELVGCLESSSALPGRRAQKTRDGREYDALMVVASLIATMAFTAALNPPGGVWQDATPIHLAHYPFFSCDGKLLRDVLPVPGTSIFADLFCNSYRVFILSNGAAFVSSLTVILLLISGFPYNRLFSIILTLIMWTALSATAITFVSGSGATMSNDIWRPFQGPVEYFQIQFDWAYLVWPGLVGCLLLGHTVRLIKNSKIKWFIIKVASIFRVGPTASSFGGRSRV